MPGSSDRLREARIAVVGAGVVGSAIAYRVAQAGAKVTVVERRSPGSGTSSASFAWTNSFGKQPREYYALNLLGIREHEVLAAELNGDWLHADGGLLWADGADGQRSRELQQKVRLMKSWGYRVDVVSPAEVTREIERDLVLDGDSVEEVYRTPQEGWLETTPMCHRLVQEAVERYGAELARGEVSAFEMRGGGIDGLRLADGRTFPADVVVNAAGPDAARIAGLAGAELPLRLQPGALIVTSPAPTCLRHVVRSPGLNLRPDGGGRMALHLERVDSFVTAGGELRVDGDVARDALARAAGILPAAGEARPEGCRTGVRPMPLDGRSIVGFDAGVSGLYQAVTHSGVTLAAILGRLVAEELAGLDAPDLNPFRPARFLTQAVPASTGDTE